MKFQNPSFKFFLNRRTNKRTSRKQYAPHFFKLRSEAFVKIQKKKWGGGGGGGQVGGGVGSGGGGGGSGWM